MKHDILAAKAELYLTLSRAFAPPVYEDSFTAFVDILPAELGEIAREAGHDLQAEVGEYARAAGKLRDLLHLQQTYSGLFLVPPREIQLHVSVYLDGTILGGSSDGIVRAYAEHGLGRSDDFRDLPDHLTVVLEFLAYLYGKAAESDGYPQADLIHQAEAFNRSYLLSWVPVMRRQLARTVETDAADRSAIYLALAGVLEKALVADAGELTPLLRQVLDPSTVVETNQAESKDMARCRECGTDIAPAARIRRVKKVLEKEGIDTAHLDLCPRCRGIDIAPMGLAGRA